MNWNKKPMGGGKSAAVLTASFIALASPAFAQDAPTETNNPPPAREARQGAGLDEIIVTAQYREEQPIDIPLSITAIGSAEIENITAGYMTDLALKIPNVLMSEGSISPSISIRGVSSQSNVNAGFPPAIGVYVDGVYQGRDPTFNTVLNDVARVEVLRGPQGTLYGKNTIGGTINIITQDPTNEFEAFGDLTIGNLELFQTRATISGALAPDVLQARLSVVHRERGGWVDNEYDDSELNDTSANGGRLVLRFNPMGEDGPARFRFSGDYFKETGTSALETGPAVLGAIPVFAGIPEQDENDNVVQLNTPEFFHRELYGVAAQADFDLPFATLTSITAYRQYTSDFDDDSDGLSVDAFNVGREENAENFSQELRLTSADDLRFRWILGAYYYSENIENIRRTRLGPIFPYLLAGAGIPFWTEETGRTYSTIESESYAFFGSGTFDITDDLHLSAGLRWTHEAKDFFYHQYYEDTYLGLGGTLIPNFAVLIPATTEEYRDDQWTYDAALTYDFSDDMVGYARYARGYKAGGFQTDVISPPFVLGDPLGFEPEFVDSYEIGLKTYLFDRRLRADISAFQFEWTDKQEQVFTGLSFLIRNAATAKNHGIELELEARPTDDWTFDLNFAWQRARYGEFPLDPSSSGKSFGLPEFTGSFGAQYDAPLNEALNLFARADVAYIGESYVNTANTLSSPSITTYNLRVGLESQDGRWGAYLWGHNITDEVRVGGGSTFPFPFAQITTRGPSLGRTYGLELRARY